jgi:hypothetical protein
MLIASWTMATTAAVYDDPGPDVYTQLHPTASNNVPSTNPARSGMR